MAVTTHEEAGEAWAHSAPDDAHFFLSFAPADATSAVWLARMLQIEGYEIAGPVEAPGDTVYFDAMRAGLGSEARVIALLSPAYLASRGCLDQANMALSGDPANRLKRLIPLIVRPCKPSAAIAAADPVDLVRLMHDPEAFRHAILEAVSPPNRKAVPTARSALETSEFASARVQVGPAVAPAASARTDSRTETAMAAEPMAEAVLSILACYGEAAVPADLLSNEFGSPGDRAALIDLLVEASALHDASPDGDRSLVRVDPTVRRTLASNLQQRGLDDAAAGAALELVIAAYEARSDLLERTMLVPAALAALSALPTSGDAVYLGVRLGDRIARDWPDRLAADEIRLLKAMADRLLRVDTHPYGVQARALFNRVNGLKPARGSRSDLFGRRPAAGQPGPAPRRSSLLGRLLGRT